MQTHWAALLAAGYGFVWLPDVCADPGVSAQKVLIGMSAPLTGSQAHRGRELAQGLQSGLAQINVAGGIGGRRIELVVRDDGGRPEQAVANTRALLDEGVFALTGYVGSRSIDAALPLVEQSGVPWIGAASSAEVLRDPTRRTVFNLRAGAREEVEAMVLHVATAGLSEIAVVAQEDVLGRAGLDGVRFELVRRGMRPATVVNLALGAEPAAVERAVDDVCKAAPQAVVLALDAGNALAVIRATRARGCRPQFCAMSEAGAELLSIPGEPSEFAGAIVSQVMPHPAATSMPLVADFQRQFAKAGAEPTHGALEGYLYGRVIAEALRRCGYEPTRDVLTSVLERQPLEVGGYRLRFAPADHRGSRLVEMTIVTPDGRLGAVESFEVPLTESGG